MRSLPDVTDWILHNSCDDINYKSKIPQLTDKQLAYCIERETRKTGMAQLFREQKRREKGKRG